MHRLIWVCTCLNATLLEKFVHWLILHLQVLEVFGHISISFTCFLCWFTVDVGTMPSVARNMLQPGTDTVRGLNTELFQGFIDCLITTKVFCHLRSKWVIRWCRMIWVSTVLKSFYMPLYIYRFWEPLALFPSYSPVTITDSPWTPWR